jgi:hypothetical protein
MTPGKVSLFFCVVNLSRGSLEREGGGLIENYAYGTCMSVSLRGLVKYRILINYVQQRLVHVPHEYSDYTARAEGMLESHSLGRCRAMS